jgi:biotin operon repressor
MLSEELGVSRQTIYKHIGAYEEYLKRQNIKNREEGNILK